MSHSSTSPAAKSEDAWYIALALALGVAELMVGFVFPALGMRSGVLQQEWFGFSQLQFFGAPLALALLALLFLRIRRLPSAQTPATSPPRRLGSPWIKPAVALAAVAVFFLLRSEFVNSDGQMFGGTFQHALRTGSSVATHDELMEFYVHDSFWIAAHEWWGWKVKFTYQVMSCLAGGGFVLLLLEYCGLVSSRPWTLFGLCLAGGYVQLFFGDVENYTLTATLLMSYFLASALFLRGRAQLWQPAVLLAIAMTFHLVAGFLSPSLAYLGWVGWRRGGRQSVLASAALFLAVLVATLMFFQWNGVPLANLWRHSHALGEGGHFGENVVRPSFAYYRDIFNLLLLLVPAVLLAIPLGIHRRFARSEENAHLAIAAVALLLFVCTWRAQIGVYEDWNLFAAVALPVSLLVWRSVLEKREGSLRPVVAFGAIAARIRSRGSSGTTSERNQGATSTPAAAHTPHD